MIYGYLHQGSGIGNQLFRYIATRIKAQDLGTDWRMIYQPDNSGKVQGFKAKDFIHFDENKIIYSPPDYVPIWNEKKVVEGGIDIRSYDPEFNFIEGNVVIDGEFQDERYWEYREKEVNEWLKVKYLEVPNNTCVIGFRGGEFSNFPDLFLAKEYWNDAILAALNAFPEIGAFQVHTDDRGLAKEFFPSCEIISDPEINWRSMRYAKCAIIANSSFYILPRWYL